MPTLEAVDTAVREFALSLPGTTEDFPWGERVFKVNGKVFVFNGKPENGGFGMSVKLPDSGEQTLALPYARPTGYGLGKSGWVSVRFAPADQPDLEPLLTWIEESWRAVAPKKLVKARAALKDSARTRSSDPAG